jgi:3-isopropylmalate/(R)-2-methylmalate dehydratase large subunit
MTLFDKIWARHLVSQDADGSSVLYIDRHYIHEVVSPLAFEGLRANGQSVRRPEMTIGVVDHIVPTRGSRSWIEDEAARTMNDALARDCEANGIEFFSPTDPRQGIIHVIGPEQGLTLPGMTIACGDSHTATHGAFGTLAFGVSTSDVQHVLATQTLRLMPLKNMRIIANGRLGFCCTPKDLILSVIGKIGTSGGAGHVIEYAGSALEDMSMEARMTVCNMTVEGGARAGLIAPDEKTFEYLRSTPNAPHGDVWQKALAYWQTLRTDPDARFDAEVTIDVSVIEPQVSWGTSPENVAPISGRVPRLSDAPNEKVRAAWTRMLDYMGLQPNQLLTEIPIDVVFVGSCTNARLEDLRSAASVLKGRRVASSVEAIVVPGSTKVKLLAEAEGLDRVFTEAGFEWRESGCSMCLGMNSDRLSPGQRCASTSNRNFEGRQGPGGRTHLMSPAMAAAAAVTGALTDVRMLVSQEPVANA